MCIWTARVKIYGPSLERDMRKVYDKIKEGNMTKAMCLEMRDSFQ